VTERPPFAGTRVLVTGARGFLASHLRRRLTAAGAELHALSRGAAPEASGGRWWQGVCDDPETARRLFAEIRPQIVYHLAGEVTAAPDPELVIPTFESLLASTVHVLLEARAVGCRRVVLAASLTEPDDGARPAIPGSPYAAAKWAASGYGRMFHALYGLEVVAVRPYMAYGPGQSASKLVPSAIRALLAGEPPRLSSGRSEADWVFVDDVVEGLVLAGSVPYPGPASIDLGSGRLASIRTVVDTIRSVLGSDVAPAWGALPDRPLERPRVADLADARARLGWGPHVSLREGLARTVAALRKDAAPAAARARA
jgi:nucleoside-diphosphate-sugar epimerase